MRRQDHVGQTLQRRPERVRRAGRLDREHVDSGAVQVAAAQRPGQRVEVHHHAAAVVDQVGAGAHGGEFGGADHAGGAGGFGHMQADHVAGGQQLVQADHRLGVAVAQFVGDVVVDHPHAHRLGHVAELAADAAIADDAQRFAAHLKAALGRLVPAAGMGAFAAAGDAPQQHDDLPDHQLGHAAGVGERRVEDRDAVAAGGGEVHLVSADAEAADQHQPVGGGEYLGGELGARADAENVNAGQRPGQLRAVQRLGDTLDLRVAGRGEHAGGAVADAFQQQHADFVFA